MPTINQTKAKLQTFRKQPRGWDAVDAASIAQAGFLLSRAALEGVTRADAFSSPDGQLSITLYNGRRSLSIRIETPYLYHLVEDIENKVVDENYDASLLEARGKIWDFSHNTRIMSASSTFRIGSQMQTAFPTFLLTDLKRKQTERPEASQSSQPTVSVNTDEAFANIYESITLPT